MSATMMIATATNVPATFPGLEKNPPELLDAAATTVWVSRAGGAVGVTVRVRSTPVTVSTVITGVGDQVGVLLVYVLVEVERTVGVTET